MMKVHVGNAPCSWGALEFDGMQGKGAPYERVLDEMAETGYEGTEFGDWGFLPTGAVQLRNELAKRHLVMLGAFVPVAFKDPAAHAAGEAHALKVAKLLADVAHNDHPPFLILADANGTDPVRTKNAGRIQPQMELTAKDWKVFAKGVEHVARVVMDETGLRTAFHHHCAGYVETPGEMLKLMELTDPALVGLVLDTGHYAYGAGGGAVLDAFRLFPHRIWHIHLKDCEPKIASHSRTEEWDYFEAVRRGVFCELGQGSIDFHAVLDCLRNRRYAGWAVVEQDVLPGMGTPKESAQRNREFLRHIGI